MQFNNPTSTKNENKKYDNSTRKKINRPLTLGGRGLPNPGHAGAGLLRECSSADANLHHV